MLPRSRLSPNRFMSDFGGLLNWGSRRYTKYDEDKNHVATAKRRETHMMRVGHAEFNPFSFVQVRTNDRFVSFFSP